MLGSALASSSSGRAAARQRSSSGGRRAGSGNSSSSGGVGARPLSTRARALPARGDEDAAAPAPSRAAAAAAALAAALVVTGGAAPVAPALAAELAAAPYYEVGDDAALFERYNSDMEELAKVRCCCVGWGDEGTNGALAFKGGGGLPRQPARPVAAPSQSSGAKRSCARSTANNASKTHGPHTHTHFTTKRYSTSTPRSRCRPS